MRKLYQCPLCGVSFGTEILLDCHYRNFHDDVAVKQPSTLTSATSDKKFKCTMCEYRSSRKYDVIRHQGFKHKNVDQVKNGSKSNQLMGSSQMREDSDDNDTLYVSDEDSEVNDTMYVSDKDDSDIKGDSELEEENNVPYISDKDKSEEENDSPYVSDEKTDDNVTIKGRNKTLNHIKRLKGNKIIDFLEDQKKKMILRMGLMKRQMIMLHKKKN